MERQEDTLDQVALVENLVPGLRAAARSWLLTAPG